MNCRSAGRQCDGGPPDAPKELQDRLNAEVRTEVTLDAPEVLVPEWAPMATAGMGSWMTAVHMRNTTLPSGSSATGTKTVLPRLDDMLTHRGYNLSENNTIYVRGHLLNDHLRGPSVPYSVVP